MSWPPPNYRPDRGTGYAITFDEFRRIISDPGWQDIARGSLKEWFGFEIRGERDTAMVTSDAGDIIDLETLHRQIQADPRQQYDLYQRAMSVWR